MSVFALKKLYGTFKLYRVPYVYFNIQHELGFFTFFLLYYITMSGTVLHEVAGYI